MSWTAFEMGYLLTLLCASPEISLPRRSVSLAPRLQPGEKGRTKSRSRFNGFGAGWQTVETVRSGLAPCCTGLKPAKATVLMRGQEDCEICGLRKTSRRVIWPVTLTALPKGA